MQNIFNFTCFLLVFEFSYLLLYYIVARTLNIVKNSKNLIKGAFFYEYSQNK